MGLLTRVVLEVEMGIWTDILIKNILVTIFSRRELHYDELILEGKVESSDDESEFNEK